ncbi:MAG: hypothetical protein OEN23_13570 [Paracoccaceae bacterium]|nr:hypothetical protein [Paracoccaceae bacterium]
MENHACVAQQYAAGINSIAPNENLRSPRLAELQTRIDTDRNLGGGVFAAEVRVAEPTNADRSATGYFQDRSDLNVAIPPEYRS